MLEPDDVVPDVLAGTVWAPDRPRPVAEDSRDTAQLQEPGSPADLVNDGTDENTDDSTDDGTDDDDGAGAEEARRPDGRRARAAVVALALVVLALAATSALLVRSVRRHDARSARGDAAVAAARQAAVNFTSIDYRTLDRDLDRVADGATGEFRREFADQATSKEFTDRARNTKVVSVGEVIDAALADLGDDRAVVLVIADSTVTNSSLPAPGAVRHVRLRLTMALVGGRWLVSDLAPAA